MAQTMIFYPPRYEGGKYHAVNKDSIAQSAICGSAIEINKNDAESIHYNSSTINPHPILCKKCLKAGA